jgi:hypothetical protein
MAKTKTQILDLIGRLSLNFNNTDISPKHYDNVIERLGMSKDPAFYELGTINVTAGQAQYDYLDNMLKIIYMFVDNHFINQATEKELNAYNQTWRADSAVPWAYFQDYQNKQFKLYPKPSIDGQLLRIFYTYQIETDIRDYYALPIALMVMAKDFSFSALQQNPALSDICMQLAKLIFKMLGHNDLPRDKSDKQS